MTTTTRWYLVGGELKLNRCPDHNDADDADTDYDGDDDDNNNKNNDVTNQRPKSHKM